jgi:hypothetical protein
MVLIDTVYFEVGVCGIVWLLSGTVHRPILFLLYKPLTLVLHYGRQKYCITSCFMDARYVCCRHEKTARAHPLSPIAL